MAENTWEIALSPDEPERKQETPPGDGWQPFALIGSRIVWAKAPEAAIRWTIERTMRIAAEMKAEEVARRLQSFRSFPDSPEPPPNADPKIDPEPADLGACDGCTPPTGMTKAQCQSIFALAVTRLEGADAALRDRLRKLAETWRTTAGYDHHPKALREGYSDCAAELLAALEDKTP